MPGAIPTRMGLGATRGRLALAGDGKVSLPRRWLGSWRDSIRGQQAKTPRPLDTALVEVRGGLAGQRFQGRKDVVVGVAHWARVPEQADAEYITARVCLDGRQLAREKASV